MYNVHANWNNMYFMYSTSKINKLTWQIMLILPYALIHSFLINFQLHVMKDFNAIQPRKVTATHGKNPSVWEHMRKVYLYDNTWENCFLMRKLHLFKNTWEKSIFMTTHEKTPSLREHMRKVHLYKNRWEKSIFTKYTGNKLN